MSGSSLQIKALDEKMMEVARARQKSLTKPAGSLGRLEELAIFLAGAQSREKPQAERVHISIFAADHGVAVEGVSAYPQSVTLAMVKNFATGGAAISVVAKNIGAHLEVVDVGTVAAMSDAAADQMHGVRVARVGSGTANFTQGPAMSMAQCERAMKVGRECARTAFDAKSDIFIGGEMGIGNTTAAAALCCVVLAEPPVAMVGPGTGVDQAGIGKKIEVIDRALALHSGHLSQPLEILRRLGGFEVAALTGAYLACAQMGLVALVDGFISSTAALLAERIMPGARTWMLFAHRSAEPGHGRVLAALYAEPLLQLNMRLGEGSGAAMAIPLLRLACVLHNGMATFAEAQVEEKL